MRRKTTPMKYHGFYCTDELWKEMQECAVTVNESDSEYIRGSILERIKSNNVRCMAWNDEAIKASLDKALKEMEKIHSNMVTVEMKPENLQAPIDKIKKQQENPKYKPDATDKQPGPIKLNSPQEVKTFFKK